jgi:hypothetical protein
MFHDNILCEVLYDRVSKNAINEFCIKIFHDLFSIPGLFSKRDSQVYCEYSQLRF